MTHEEARQLDLGLYLLFWKSDGGVSLAAVGSLYDGRRWFAPTNWVAPRPGRVASIDWDMIDHAEKFDLEVNP